MATHPGKTVPVLITADVDFSRHHALEDKQAAFESLLSVARDAGAAITFYFVANEAAAVGEIPERLRAAGHEIGCHGLRHDEEEEYSTLPMARQAELVQAATGILRNLAGTEIRAFRAPRVKVSADTYRVLAAEGYLTDSSVCSQRFDLISSNLVNVGWLTAPRRPYQPSAHSPYRRGTLPLLVVPISAIAVPFISSALYVLGVRAMKLLFRLLYAESLRTGKPIVYLFHPYEFAGEIPGARDYGKNVRVHGLRFRRHLYRGGPQDKLAWTAELLGYIGGFEHARFMTMSEFAAHHRAQAG